MAMERIRARMAQNNGLYGTEKLEETKQAEKRSKRRTLPPNRIGNLPDMPVGKKWSSRAECCRDGMHRKTVAGISGSGEAGAYSVVISGGYDDDDDEGDTFIYTGTGGRPEGASYSGVIKQTKDQTFDHPDNKALLRSSETKLPVRVIRGANKNSTYAPPSGFRYDGLYIVDKVSLEDGVDGYLVCKAHFRRVSGQPPIPTQWRTLG